MCGESMNGLESTGEKVRQACIQYYTELLERINIVPSINARFNPFPFLDKASRSIYYYYPFLFRRDFPQVDEDDLMIIALSGCLYLDHIMINDSLIDQQQAYSALPIMLSSLLHEKAICLLQKMFAASSPFWGYLEQYHLEYTRAVFLEKERHVRALSPYDAQEMERIARGKLALAKASTTALAIRANDISKLDFLTQSQDCFAIASQLYDDLLDWKEDWQQRRYSYLLSMLPLQGDEDLTTVGQVMYYSGAAEAVLQQSIGYVELALRHVQDLQCQEWKGVLESFRGRLDRLATDIREIRERTLREHVSSK